MKTKKTLLLLLVLPTLVASAQTEKLTKKIKAETVANIAASLKANYIYLDTATRMCSFIQHQLKLGRYDTIKTPGVLADRLTTDILSVYHDGHLSIRYDPAYSKADGAHDTVLEKKRMAEFRKKLNLGFDKVELLTGKIGYVNIRGFFEPDAEAKKMALAAFRLVSNSETLIIDLRNNTGGNPDMVSFICGLFFNNKTHLNDLYSRRDKSETAYWTTPDTTIKALYSIPIYILTSNRTFSAAEEFAYDLQTQKRALVIGEKTGGGAHPVQPFPVGNGFIANVPFARAINPITKIDWESTGVKPDKDVRADQALEFILEMIRHK